MGIGAALVAGYTAIGGASTLATAATVGATAYSTYSSYSAGKTAATAQGRNEQFNALNDRFNLATESHNAAIDEMFAVANIKQQRAQAYQQHAIAENSAAWARYENEVNRRVVDAVATAQIKALGQEARAIDSRGRESIRRTRDQSKRIGSTQRARTAKMGAVVDTGTPLDVAIETAGNIELAIQDQKYGSDLESKALRDQASQIDYERNMTLQLDQVSSDYGISKMLALSQFERDVSNTRGNLAQLGATTQRRLREIDISNRLWGVDNRPSQVPGMQAANRANLISGIAGTVGSAYSALNTAGVFSPQPYASVRPASGYSGANV